MTQPHNIYIHVPFCMSKCNYCAFFSRACAAPDWDEYANKIISEIDFWAQTCGDIDVPTIFFGGGTPSLMPAATFDRIIGRIAQRFHIVNNAEITAEANPGTIDGDKLSDFISAGLNRLSVGVQRLNDDDLRFMGRRHTAHDALKLLDAAAQKNIRVSADFIYGLPGDTVATVTQLCHDINTLPIEHCSMYELTIEDGTPFSKMNLDMPNNTEMANMYNAVAQSLHHPRYEVSNYAAPNAECRHNQNIWDGAPYIGIGRGAAGRVLIDNTWYEQMGDGALFSPISDSTRATEKIITGLRTVRGVATTPDVMAKINHDFVKNNPHLVQVRGDRICATDRGMLILDNLLLELIG